MVRVEFRYCKGRLADTQHRTGAITFGRSWEGRYKSHLIASDEHLLRCYRYIELNPVRAGMVATADQYRWSSHAGNASAPSDPLLHHHDCYLHLGANASERQRAYRELVQQASAEYASRFSHHLHHQHPMGNDRFRAAIETQLGRTVTLQKVGRPK